MLFSEPKIPQFQLRMIVRGLYVRFSALQRAENSSIRRFPVRRQLHDAVSVLFSEPKIPQSPQHSAGGGGGGRFQCSSASRKFLNPNKGLEGSSSNFRFSALQRAENSSIHSCGRRKFCVKKVSVLFSEPKIPQSVESPSQRKLYTGVSVLFSEPKIPQSNAARACTSCARVSVLFSEPKIPQ